MLPSSSELELGTASTGEKVESPTSLLKLRSESVVALPIRCRVICVDDVLLNCLVLKTALRTFAPMWEVVTSCRPADVLEMLLEKGEKFDLLITDVEMGNELSGFDLVLKLRKRNIHLPVILCSGTYTHVSYPVNHMPHIDAFWPKPIPDWRNGDMQRSLTELLSRSSAAPSLM